MTVLVVAHRWRGLKRRAAEEQQRNRFTKPLFRKRLEIGIALLRRPGVLLLKIQDNGWGIRPDEAANPRTMGLLGMPERALPFGGEVRVGPGPRGGTRVLAILPL